VVCNILVGREWTSCGVQYSSREVVDQQWCPIFLKGGSGLAVVSTILERRKWTGSGVQ
jgi:hypothetical protein